MVKLLIAGAFVLVVVFLLIASSSQSKPGKLDEFAKCLTEKGTVFYGAYWCPHCQNQKKLFDSSEKFLPYVECSTPDGKGQLEVCKQKNIQGYPTWEFKDGSRKTGEVPLEELSKKTSCPLPKN